MVFDAKIMRFELYEHYIFIRMFNKFFDEEFAKLAREIHLTQPQYLALEIVRNHEGLLISEIAKIGSWHVSTALKVVNKLGEKGLVKMEPASTGRGWKVYLTDAGHKLSNERPTTSSLRLQNYLESMGPQLVRRNFEENYQLLAEAYGKEFRDHFMNYMLKALAANNGVTCKE